MQKVYLVIKHLQRHVRKILVQFHDDMKENSAWFSAYQHIIKNLQEEIAKSYKGGVLNLKPLIL